MQAGFEASTESLIKCDYSGARPASLPRLHRFDCRVVVGYQWRNQITEPLQFRLSWCLSVLRICCHHRSPFAGSRDGRIILAARRTLEWRGGLVLLVLLGEEKEVLSSANFRQPLSDFSCCRFRWTLDLIACLDLR